MKQSLWVGGVVLAISFPARAQSTYVVDAAGGPGSNFTTLSDAVAAAGTQFTGVGGAGARISGIDFVSLWIVSCTGPVLLDGTDVLGGLGASPAGPPALRVEGCADVRFQGSALRGNNGLTAGDWGQPAALVHSSRVELGSCSVIGGDGRHFNLQVSALDGGNGGWGIRCESGSRVHLARTDVRGGKGGNGCSALCSGVGGDGGNAVEVRGGSTVVLAGSPTQAIVGGAPGSGLQDGSAGLGVLVWASVLRHSGVAIASGDPLVQPIVNVGGVVVQPPIPDPTLERLGIPTPGSPLTFRLHATAGSYGRLQQGNQPLVIADGLVEIERLCNRIRLHPMGPLTASTIDLVMVTPPGAPPGWLRLFQGLEIDGSAMDLRGRTNSAFVIVR